MSREQRFQGGANGAMRIRIALAFVALLAMMAARSAAPLASMVAVEEAQIPESGPDRGTTEEDWVTNRIGEEAGYLRPPVANGLLSVSEATSNAGVAGASGRAVTKCRAVTESNEWPRPLWVFSPYACGAYGFSDLVITHAGRTNPVGRDQVGGKPWGRECEGGQRNAVAGTQ